MDKDFTLLITLGIASMLLLAAGFLLIVIRNQRKKWHLQVQMSQLKEQQQNQLIEAAVKSEEGERHRIAETLHDEVGAILSSVRLHFSNINQSNLDDRSIQLHDKSKELLDEGIQKVRSISHNLHSSLLKEFGLNEAILNFLTKIVQGTLVKVDINLDPSYLIQHPQTDIGIYRIVQELVNNILKHAKASYITISSACNVNTLELVLRFNGSGLTQEQFEELRYKRDGLGLKNIQNRMILLKGYIYFEKENPDNSIKLTIPLNEGI